MDKVLEFVDKQEVITLEELNASGKLKNADDKHVVETQRVYADITALLAKHKAKYEIKSITAKGGAHALYSEELEQYVGKHNIKAYTLLRTEGIIIFPELSNETTTMQIRIDVTERGITLSCGKLVLVCTNGMTAFRGDMCTTYGSRKVQYKEALNIVENWIQNIEQKSSQYDKIINDLAGIKVNKDIVKHIIGNLMYEACQGNMTNDVAPLNVTQVSAFTNAYIGSEDEDDTHVKVSNAWELYNLGTELLKFDNMDMTIIAERNYAFTTFILDYFKLNEEQEEKF